MPVTALRAELSPGADHLTTSSNTRDTSGQVYRCNSACNCAPSRSPGPLDHVLEADHRRAGMRGRRIDHLGHHPARSPTQRPLKKECRSVFSRKIGRWALVRIESMPYGALFTPSLYSVGKSGRCCLLHFIYHCVGMLSISGKMY